MAHSLLRYRNYLFLFLVISIFSCAPASKESYLENYKDFMNEVTQNSNSYTKEDWTEKDKIFHEYSDVWKNKFNKDLTWKEDLILVKYELKYAYLSHKKETSELLNKFLFDDVKLLREQLKDYSKNNMEEDILFIVEQSKEMGEDAYNMVLELLEDLEIEVDEITKNINKNE